MNKQEYTVQELIHNQSFQRMVKGTAGDQEIKDWNKWIEASEKNRDRAREATAEITGFGFSEPAFPNIDHEWKKLYQSTIGKRGARFSKKRKKYSAVKWMYRVAAVLILGAFVGAGLYMYSPDEKSLMQLEQITEEKTVSTESGEQKTIRFSNNSKIVLNSDSEITYSLLQDHDQTIEVVVEGEAYFDADSNFESAQPIFAVNTPDGVIRDIGTKFMVTVQSDRSQVVLEEGEVQIITKDQGNSDQILMNAGELIEFNKTKVLSKKKVNTSFYTSWETGYMEFNQTKVQDFASFVEQRFGVDVQVTDSRFDSITLDGAIYFKSLAGLVRSVSEVTNITVYESADRDTVFIGDPYSEIKEQSQNQ